MVSSVPEAAGRATALWLLAGLDPSGGAGLLRDTWTARACAPALPIARTITAWTRQGEGRPATAEPRPTAALLRELQLMPPPRAIKIGLLPAALVAPVLHAVKRRGAPIVLDPVLHASDGGDLGGRADALRQVLSDISEETWLVTPNRREAAALAGAGPDDPDLLARVAARLGKAAVLLKDGHGRDPARVRDEAWLSGQAHSFDRPRVGGPDPRGTGCALATAIACGLARGRTQLQAITDAVAWLDQVRTKVIRGSDGLPHLPKDAPPLPG
jgi:hydroxymethylpyrimidine/phosphomethylpyrimidine kinase